MAINSANLQFIYTESDSSSINQYIDLETESTSLTQQSITKSSNVPRIPNQCWSGYYDESVYQSSISQIETGVLSNIKYTDFGVSILKYGCAVCCCIGAANHLNKSKAGYVPLSVSSLYNKHGFVWRKNSVNSKGQINGVTLAKWGSVPGVTISNGSIHYDSDRQYAFTKKNSAYSATPSLTSAQISAYSSQFYVPTSSDTAIYKESYHNELDDLFKAYQVLGMQKIKQDLDSGYLDILYLCNSVHNTGHYVVAYAFNNIIFTNRSGQYAADEILVVDPCPNKYNKGSYYGVYTSLASAMKRINGDISDGIRTVATVKSTL